MNIFLYRPPAYDGSKNEPKTKTVLAIINWHNHLLLHGQKSLDTALNVIRDLFIWKLYGTKSEACLCAKTSHDDQNYFGNCQLYSYRASTEHYRLLHNS